MKDKYIIFEPLKIDFNLYFLGTEEEQEEADAKQATRAAELERVLFAPDFIAAEYINSWSQRRILHKSTRPGIMYQLSFIDPDGVPAMHENYISDGTGNPDEVGKIHDRAELIRHFINNNNENPLTLHILSA